MDAAAARTPDYLSMKILKSIKYIFYTLVMFFLLWWFFLSHVTFLKEGDMVKAINSNDNFFAKYYEPYPTNLFGLYISLTESQPVFVVLYNKDNNYIGQSSPFNMVGKYTFIDTVSFLPKKEYKKPLDHSYFIVIEGEDDAYDIDINHKKWWSKILQYFH
ncbi:DUF6201 family protein [Xenorhabdus sp. PR6a]|uniref:DUF6201 family protein n=1 Tax=Xenorhabdus sp. PR6a TaxID=3025877 RepID=UPI00307FDD15